MTPLNNLPDSGKHALDALAALTVAGALADILPPLAAGLSIIWLCLQIFGWIETRIKAAKTPKN